jgi:hypothetical protein
MWIDSQKESPAFLHGQLSFCPARRTTVVFGGWGITHRSAPRGTASPRPVLQEGVRISDRKPVDVARASAHPARPRDPLSNGIVVCSAAKIISNGRQPASSPRNCLAAWGEIAFPPQGTATKPRRASGRAPQHHTDPRRQAYRTLPETRLVRMCVSAVLKGSPLSLLGMSFRALQAVEQQPIKVRIILISNGTSRPGTDDSSPPTFPDPA